MGDRIICPQCGHNLVSLVHCDLRSRDKCNACGHEFNEYAPALPPTVPSATMPGMSIEKTEDGKWWYLRVGALCNTDDVSLYELRARITAALSVPSAPEVSEQMVEAASGAWTQGVAAQVNAALDEGHPMLITQRDLMRQALRAALQVRAPQQPPEEK